MSEVVEHDCSKFLGDETPILTLHEGEYYPATRYRCRICGKEVWSDGIWWCVTGIPRDVVWIPEEPKEDEVVINYFIGKVKVVREKRIRG